MQDMNKLICGKYWVGYNKKVHFPNCPKRSSHFDSRELLMEPFLSTLTPCGFWFNNVPPSARLRPMPRCSKLRIKAWSVPGARGSMPNIKFSSFSKVSWRSIGAKIPLHRARIMGETPLISMYFQFQVDSCSSSTQKPWRFHQSSWWSRLTPGTFWRNKGDANTLPFGIYSKTWPQWIIIDNPHTLAAHEALENLEKTGTTSKSIKHES